MLTAGIPADVRIPTATLRRSPVFASRRFFVWMGGACALIAIAGFVPTYWAPVASGRFDGSLVLHLHGLLFSAWPLLFIAQAALAATNRIERHRVLGYVGIALATGMLFAGTIVVVGGLESGIAQGFEPQVRAFSIVPLSILWCFVAAVVAALANVRRPDVHMRLMLVATITLLTPAIARLFILVLAPPGSPGPGIGEPPTVGFALMPSIVTDLLLVVPMVHDWRKHGRPHPIYFVSAFCLLAVQIVRIPLSATPAWHAVTSWLLHAAGS